MDFGWDHPQSHIQLYIDKDTDAIYVARGWKQSKVSANDAWGAIRSWADKTPTAWPHDGLQNEKGRDDATQQKTHYMNAGFKMLPMMATWPDIPDGKGGTSSGGNSVEQGLYEILDKMHKGMFKIFDDLHEVMEEVRQYHRDEKGKIVKVKDDLLDAIRYAYMMRRFAARISDIGIVPTVHRPQPIKRLPQR